MNIENDWNVYRTRFVVRARQLTDRLEFNDALGREHRGEAGDYLVEIFDGLFTILPRKFFEDIYVPLASQTQSSPRALRASSGPPAERGTVGPPPVPIEADACGNGVRGLKGWQRIKMKPSPVRTGQFKSIETMRIGASL